MRRFGSLLPAGVALLVVLTGALFACATRAGELPAHAGEIQNHLEFLGYEVSRNDDSILAIHEERPNLQIRRASGGTLLLSYWQANDYARAHRAEFLELVNYFNANATTATFYIDDDGDLGFSGWFIGDYEKMRFAQFLERWNRDWADLVQRDFDRAQKFLE
jgi:L-rhamnose mutarotase